MVDGINAGDCVEAGFGKWKLLASIDDAKLGSAFKATFIRKKTCC